MADIGKLLSATKLQLIILIVLGLISIGINYTVYSSATTMEEVLANPLMMVSTLLGLIGLLVTIWAGYIAAKAVSGGAVEGGLAGALVSVIEAIVCGVVSLILVMPLIEKIGGAALAGLAGAIGAVALVIGIVISAILGFIFGAIGGFIGKAKK